MRTYFPTRNTMGVRSFSPTQTLGRMQRDPAAAAPKAAMTPTLLGAPMTPTLVNPTSPFHPNPRSPIQMFPQSGAPSGAAPTSTSLQTTPTPTVNAQGWAPPNWVSVSSGGGTATAPTAASTSQANAVLAQYQNTLASYNGYVSSGNAAAASSAYRSLQNLADQLGPLGVNVTLPAAPATSNPWGTWGGGSPPSSSSGASANSLLSQYNSYLALYNQAISASNSSLANNYATTLMNLASQLNAMGITVTLPAALTGTATLPAASGTSESTLLASYNQYLTLYNQMLASGNTSAAANYASTLQTLAAQLAALGVTVSLPTNVSTGVSSSQVSSLQSQYNQLLTEYANYMATGDTADATTIVTEMQSLSAQLAPLGVIVTPPALPTSTTAVASTAAMSTTDEVASWLGGSTAIGGYAVPNALLAGAVVLGFAMLMGRKK